MKSIKSSGNRVSFDRVIYIIRLFIAAFEVTSMDVLADIAYIFSFFFFKRSS